MFDWTDISVNCQVKVDYISRCLETAKIKGLKIFFIFENNDGDELVVSDKRSFSFNMNSYDIDRYIIYSLRGGHLDQKMLYSSFDDVATWLAAIYKLQEIGKLSKRTIDLLRANNLRIDRRKHV